MPKLSPQGGKSTPQKKILKLEKFRGVDLTGGELNISLTRSPSAENMLPNLDGFPVKRHGWGIDKTYPATINGVHTLVLDSVKKTVVHAGNTLYLGDEILYSEMQNEKSKAVQMNKQLIIIDGKKLLVFGKFTQDGTEKWCIKTANSIATIPTITIGRMPCGGGKSYNPPNLLCEKVIEEFLSDGKSTTYQLSYTGLPSNAFCEIQKKTNAVWETFPTAEYTLNCENGIVTFRVAPPLSDVTGEDNIRITYQKQKSEDSVNQCKISILYGVNGQPDRLFLTGNKSHGNYVYYSQIKDPLYFGDSWYITLGGEGAEITGFSLLENKLIVHKAFEEYNQNAFVVTSGTDADGDARFPIENVLQGDGAIGGFASLGTEPLFLTNRGVFALAQSDATSKNYTQNRSYFINGELTKKQTLNSATAVVFKNFYCLAVDSVLYLLDGEQKIYEKGEPYSSHQMECYKLTNIPARVLWVSDDTLHFGDEMGNLCSFKKGNLSNDFTDGDGNAVNGFWTSPLMSLDSFSNYKTVNGVWAVCQPYARSGAKVFYLSDKEEEMLADSFNIDILNWEDIDFNRFTFNTLNRPCIEYCKKKAKKVKLFAVKVQNDRSEPFGIAALQIEYLTTGKIK